MSISRYFQDELDTLRVFGAEFSRYHPRLTSYLSERSNDPDVERLLEGFALLTGRLREKIDDQLPEVTQSLLMLLWPNYLRQVPSMCIMQMSPLAGSITERAVVPCKDLYIDGPRVDGTMCRFQPCRDVEVLPLATKAPRHSVSREKSVVTLPLRSLNDEQICAIDMKGLCFFLGGSEYSAFTLNLWLHRYLRSITVRSVASEKEIKIDAEAIRQGGLEDDDAVLPFPQNAFGGYRLLQEFYSFPEKFNFLYLDSVPSSHLGAETEFELVFDFKRPLPPDVQIDHRSFQLHCVPAINLFPHDAEPFILEGKRTEYAIVPADRDGSKLEVFSINTVTGWITGDGPKRSKQRRTYPRFESFAHEIERADNRTALYFRERVRQHVSGAQLDRQISFYREDELSLVGEGEAISVDLTCSNGQAPSRLAVGDICVPGSPIPAFVTASNITRPTRSLYPVVDGSLQWQLISALSLNYLSLENAEALRLMLRIYDFDALVDRQREREADLRQEGLVSIDTKSIDRMFRGLPVRGMRSNIVMRESCFSCEGEMYQFATVLAEFFRLYATVNSFHELVVTGQENKEVYQWMERIGNQPLI